MSMKFGKMKGTEGLLKLTKFGVATLIFGDIWLSGGATPGCARSNDLAGSFTALAPPCLGNSVNRK